MKRYIQAHLHTYIYIHTYIRTFSINIHIYGDHGEGNDDDVADGGDVLPVVAIGPKTDCAVLAFFFNVYAFRLKSVASFVTCIAVGHAFFLLHCCWRTHFTSVGCADGSRCSAGEVQHRKVAVFGGEGIRGEEDAQPRHGRALRQDLRIQD